MQVKKELLVKVRKKFVAKKSTTKAKAGFNKTDLKKIREGLVVEKGRILDELGRIREDSLNKSQKDASGDLSGYSFHMADMATDLYDREFLLGLAEGEREMLFACDDAIKRIDEGLYGKCSVCEKNISKPRLKAMPQAQNCITCQEEKEKAAKR